MTRCRRTNARFCFRSRPVSETTRTCRLVGSLFSDITVGNFTENREWAASRRILDGSMLKRTTKARTKMSARRTQAERCRRATFARRADAGVPGQGPTTMEQGAGSPLARVRSRASSPLLALRRAEQFSAVNCLHLQYWPAGFAIKAMIGTRVASPRRHTSRGVLHTLGASILAPCWFPAITEAETNADASLGQQSRFSFRLSASERSIRCRRTDHRRRHSLPFRFGCPTECRPLGDR